MQSDQFRPVLTGNQTALGTETGLLRARSRMGSKRITKELVTTEEASTYQCARRSGEQTAFACR
jgi:hypothetical protein